MKLVVLIGLLLVSNISCNNDPDEFKDDDDPTAINSKECGKRNPDNEARDQRIVGGRIVKKGDFNWQVALNYTGRLLCGGSIINSRWILTAAHCTAGRPSAASYKVIAGLHDRWIPDSYTQTLDVERIVDFETYQASGWINDISLLKLKTPLKFSDEVGPVCIPDGDTDFEDEISYASGYGTTFNNTLSRYLQAVDLRVLSEKECRGKYATFNNKVAFCAGAAGLFKDTCQGDSGGPLAVKDKGRWFNIGITSWGRGCYDGGVYTRTSNYYAWIKDKVSKL